MNRQFEKMPPHPNPLPQWGRGDQNPCRRFMVSMCVQSWRSRLPEPAFVEEAPSSQPSPPVGEKEKTSRRNGKARDNERGPGIPSSDASLDEGDIAARCPYHLKKAISGP